LKDTTAAGFDGTTFTVAAPNGFIRDWLEGRLTSTVKKTLIDSIGHIVEVSFIVKSDESVTRVSQPTALEEWAAQRPPESLAVVRQSRLSPKYTFDSFIVGKTNELSHAAAIAVSREPGKVYNPLFIYGGVGLGKTHLLQAVGHETANAGLKVVYVSSETFTNEFITSIRERSSEHFRQRYRNADVLLIDDIQFLASREQTQEEFFHTFNDLHGLNKQIVITSDRPPKSKPSLEDRLRSRFEWGLITDVQPPDLETRVAIVTTKARQLGHNLPADVIEALAHKAQSNIRELEGSLNRVIAFSKHLGVPITLDVTLQALFDSSTEVAPKRWISIPFILETVSKYYRVDIQDLKGKRRDRPIAHPRQVAMYLMREETQSSLGEIGRELGGRDHSTVIHGCDKIDNDIKDNVSLLHEINEIRTILYQKQDGKRRPH
jgi:chromosomal replication initiator protein